VSHQNRYRFWKTFTSQN